MQVLDVKNEKEKRIRLFLFDHITKFFKDVHGDFRVESLSVDVFASLVKQLNAEVIEEVGEEFRGLAEALVGERVLLLVPAEG